MKCFGRVLICLQGIACAVAACVGRCAFVGQRL